jgi:hypothetical protein
MTYNYHNDNGIAIPDRSFTEKVTTRDHSFMDAKRARTLNIRHFVAEAGGPTEFAIQYGGDRWTQAQVSQWISEKSPKPIGHNLARELEVALGLQEGEFDSWRNGEPRSDRPKDGRSHEQVVNQLENDIDALRFALAGMVAVIADERPGEGARVAAAIRKHVPQNFVVRGFLHSLLRTLDPVTAKAPVSSPRAVRSRAKP